MKQSRKCLGSLCCITWYSSVRLNTLQNPNGIFYYWWNAPVKVTRKVGNFRLTALKYPSGGPKLCIIWTWTLQGNKDNTPFYWSQYTFVNTIHFSIEQRLIRGLFIKWLDFKGHGFCRPTVLRNEVKTLRNSYLDKCSYVNFDYTPLYIYMQWWNMYHKKVRVDMLQQCVKSELHIGYFTNTWDSWWTWQHTLLW